MFQDDDDKEIPSTPLDESLPGFGKLIKAGDVAIDFQVILKIDRGKVFDPDEFRFHGGSFEIACALDSEPYEVEKILGSRLEVLRFLMGYLKLVIADEEQQFYS